MKETIRRLALDSGFDACRFTSAEPPDRGAAFQRWLEAGHHAGMAYLERTAEKRMDPRRVLAGAKSVVILGVSYHASGQEDGRHAGGPTGVVARYARHRDYHEVLAPRLEALAGAIRQHGGPGTEVVVGTDAAPFLERDLAQRAGLGFAGKHTNLISRGMGNWFFLAEVLTTAWFEPDPPEVNRCGHCTRCLSVCPTQAITAPFQLDARRCISYLTIELKGSIPEDLRPALGTRIFGCDDCLEVCPWNRFAREGRLMREERRADLSAPLLLELLRLDDAGFKHRFAGTPILRAKRRGLLRNVCVALGNLGDPRALPGLACATGDREPLVAEHATWALRRVESGLHTGVSSCSPG